METRKKYKIALSEKYVRKSENGNEWFQFPVNVSGQLVEIQTIIPLEPYTEPDLEQVRLEAEQLGMVQAWGAARKIAYMYSEERKKTFGENLIQNIHDIYSASEAIEKIRQYEQEKEEIKVGDEVTPRETEYDDMIVTRLWKDDYDSDCIDAIGFDGRIGSFLMSRVSKTGKHYEIAEVLEKMRGEQDG